MPAVISGADLPPAGFAASQAEAGLLTYTAKCATCHGGELEGGDHAPPLKGAGFLADWQAQPARKLYSRIISTMPFEDPGSLTETETLAITALIARRNGAPDGPAHAAASELDSIALTPK